MQESLHINHPTDVLPGPTSVHAMIQYNTSGFHRHRLRDIRLESAFVEMGNVRVLRKNSHLRVVFVHRDHGRSLTHLIEAIVARVEANGAWIKFVDLDGPARRALGKLQEISRRFTTQNGTYA
jgi:hypothetical protein